jgi:hypothetical protein
MADQLVAITQAENRNTSMENLFVERWAVLGIDARGTS